MIVYMNTLNLPASTGTQAAILGVLDRWISRKTHGGLTASASINAEPRQPPAGTELDVLVAGNASAGETVMGSVVFSQLDRKIRGRKWVVRVGFKIEANSAVTQVSVMGATSDYNVRAGTSPAFVTRPTVVRDLVKECGLVSPSPASEVCLLTPEKISEYVSELDNPAREYALILISPEPFSERFHAQPDDVIGQVAGMARVFAIPNKAHTQAVGEAVGKRFSAWNGAIRVLMPPLSNGYIADELILGEQLEVEKKRGKSPENHLLLLLTNRLNLSHYRHEIAPAHVRQHVLTLRLKALSAQTQGIAAQKQRLDVMQEQMELKESEIERLKKQYDNAYADWEEAETRAAEIPRLKAQIDTYEAVFEKAKGAGNALAPIAAPITSVADAIKAARERFGNQLAFSFNSKSDGEKSPYEEPREVMNAFEWLATTYYESKIGKRPCPDLDADLYSKLPGWHYAGHQKETTMKGLSAWYQCLWQGRKLWIKEHLKGGATRSRRPEESIRIAFAWEPDAEKVVIGFLGQHQDNSKS
jgi:hypothetical protein